jgi:hypothetical protein
MSGAGRLRMPARDQRGAMMRLTALTYRMKPALQKKLLQGRFAFPGRG